MRNDVSKRLKQIITLVAVALIVGMLACRGSKQNVNNANNTPAPTPAASEGKATVAAIDAAVTNRQSPFDHNRAEHKKQDCGFCHQRANNDPTPTFPQHAACNDCHQKDFTSPASQLCVVCHQMPLETEAHLINFPARLRQLGIKGFSHKDHLDPAKMPEGVAPAKCNSCHRFDSRGVEASFPKHPECYSCHTHQAGENLGECGVCHTDTAVALKYSQAGGTAYSLYNFKHGSHTKRASCDGCHRVVERGEQTRADILQISTARGQRHKSSCWSCHTQAREAVCTKCHLGSLPF